MTETKLHMTINADLKHKLKVIAAKKNMTMSEIVEELIRGYIQQEEWIIFSLLFFFFFK